MQRIVQSAVVLAVVLSTSVGILGCARDNGRRKQTVDPIIQDYMQRRSDLASQRRRLAATYGADSPTVAQVDRQIQLLDDAMALRRQQVLEQEMARQQVQRMKRDAAPLGPGEPSVPPPVETQPAQ